LIFRRYWVDNEPRDIATLGDVSLTKGLRARGFDRELMEFIGRHLGSAPDHDALAILSKADSACLNATGWRTSGSLVPYVYRIDPTDALLRLVRHPWLARSAAAVFKRVMPTALRLMNPGKSWLQFVDDVDETFDVFWRQFPKRNLIVRDMSQHALRWRYIQHPGGRFKVAKLMNREGMTGFVIFEAGRNVRTCRIHDLAVKDPRDVHRMLMLFAQHVQPRRSAATIDLIVADRHPYARRLWQSGFLARPPQEVLHVRSDERHFDRCAWHVTSSDRDV
jgi:hypothetical protein